MSQISLLGFSSKFMFRALAVWLVAGLISPSPSSSQQEHLELRINDLKSWELEFYLEAVSGSENLESYQDSLQVLKEEYGPEAKIGIYWVKVDDTNGNPRKCYRLKNQECPVIWFPGSPPSLNLDTARPSLAFFLVNPGDHLVNFKGTEVRGRALSFAPMEERYPIVHNAQEPSEGRTNLISKQAIRAYLASGDEPGETIPIEPRAFPCFPGVVYELPSAGQQKLSPVNPPAEPTPAAVSWSREVLYSIESAEPLTVQVELFVNDQGRGPISCNTGGHGECLGLKIQNITGPDDVIQVTIPSRQGAHGLVDFRTIQNLGPLDENGAIVIKIGPSSASAVSVDPSLHVRTDDSKGTIEEPSPRPDNTREGKIRLLRESDKGLPLVGGVEDVSLRVRIFDAEGAELLALDKTTDSEGLVRFEYPEADSNTFSVELEREGYRTFDRKGFSVSLLADGNVPTIQLEPNPLGLEVLPTFNGESVPPGKLFLVDTVDSAKKPFSLELKDDGLYHPPEEVSFTIESTGFVLRQEGCLEGERAIVARDSFVGGRVRQELPLHYGSAALTVLTAEKRWNGFGSPDLVERLGEAQASLIRSTITRAQNSDRWARFDLIFVGEEGQVLKGRSLRDCGRSSAELVVTDEEKGLLIDSVFGPSVRQNEVPLHDVLDAIQGRVQEMEELGQSLDLAIFLANSVKLNSKSGREGRWKAALGSRLRSLFVVSFDGRAEEPTEGSWKQMTQAELERIFPDQRVRVETIHMEGLLDRSGFTTTLGNQLVSFGRWLGDS